MSVSCRVSFLLFCLLGCGHCKSLAPEYAAAATALLEHDPPIYLGKLDATVHGEVSSKFDVRGYPTLKIFRNGKVSDYNGPRKTDGIISYMKKQVGPAARPITNDAELQALFKVDPDVGYSVVGFFSSSKVSQLQSSFNKIASEMRDDYTFGRVVDQPELAAAQGVEGGEGLVVYLRGEKIVYTGSTRASQLEEFIRQNSLPLVKITTCSHIACVCN